MIKAECSVGRFNCHRQPLPCVKITHFLAFGRDTFTQSRVTLSGVVRVHLISSRMSGLSHTSRLNREEGRIRPGITSFLRNRASLTMPIGNKIAETIFQMISVHVWGFRIGKNLSSSGCSEALLTGEEWTGEVVIQSLPLKTE